MVYVLSITEQPLMPCTEAKARKLLKQNKAKIYKRNPFTIQLLFECENVTQPITLGVDTGSKHIGLSATTEKKELFASDVELRNDHDGKEYFIFGIRTSGFFDIRDLQGNKVNNGSINCKTLKLLETQKHILIERRVAIPPQA